MMDFFSDLAVHSLYNKTFSQIAKESNFSFSLYRGRVDWKKLEILDVDRIVRDQDVELLNVNISNVTNCNLESEYDVKILDPNFIKLFKLAQLLIDFLLHCKRYLEHCIKLAHDSIQSSSKEVESLQKQLKIRKSEVKQLKKKIQDLKLQLLSSPRLSNFSHQCTLCGKTFMNENYLNGHYSRRHQGYLVGNQPPTNQSSPQSEIVREKVKKVDSNDISKIKNQYQEEIEALKNTFFAEIQKLKQKETVNVVTQIDSKDGENFDGKTSNTDKSQEKEDDHRIQHGEEREEVWQQRMEEREGVWRARLAELDQQHKRQVQDLQTRLNTTQVESQEMKKELEKRIENVLDRFEQTQSLLENKMTAKSTVSTVEVSKETNSPAVVVVTPRKESKPLARVPTYEKRRAFVSQKSKTIHEESSSDSSKTIVAANTSVEVVKSQPKKDSNIVPPQKKESAWTNTEESKSTKLSPSLFEDSGNKQESPSISKNKETIITQLLEEEREIIQPKQQEVEENIIYEDESSITETLTESESDSESLFVKNPPVNIRKRDETVSESSDDQLLRNETQLAKQSLESMEQLLAANPDILCQLREDLQQLCKRRLQELGVDPGWGGLPPSTFQNKLAVLAHQRNITAKNHKVYFTLRDKLSKDVEAAVASRPVLSTADSVMQRLRKKAAQVVNAARFSRRLVKESMKTNDDESKANSAVTIPKKLEALASSSPLLPRKFPTVQKQLLQAPKVLVTTSKDSLSLSSLTSEDEEEKTPQAEATVKSPNTSNTSLQVKSALRNAVSTSSLTKKRVLFVDQTITEEKRSKSESEVMSGDSWPAIPENKSSPVSTSVTDLVKEIQQQLNQRTGKPALAVDLMSTNKPSSFSVKGEQKVSLPLSQILPLTKSGRELLETEEKLLSEKAPSQEQVKKSSSETLTSKVAESSFLSSSSSMMSTSRQKETNVGKTLLEPLRVSPSHSLTSLGSSLLDISVSPRGPQPRTSTLEWDLQDLEENLRH